MHSILVYLKEISPFVLFSAFPCIFFRMYRRQFLRKRHMHSSLMRESVFVIFLLYFTGLLSLTILPSFLVRSTASSFGGGINYVPFRVFSQTYIEVFIHHNFDYFLLNFLGNIVGFMPVGFTLPLLFEIKYSKAVIIGSFTSITIELCQLGMPRGTDIDDIWLNTLGVLLGCLCYRLMKKRHPSVCERFKVHRT